MVGEFRYKKILHSIQSIDFIIGAFFMELIYLYLTYESSSTFFDYASWMFQNFQ